MPSCRLSPPKLVSCYYDDAEAVGTRTEDLVSFTTKLQLLIVVRVLEDRILRFAGWVLHWEVSFLLLVIPVQR